jgi:hypothetical protein
MPRISMVVPRKDLDLIDQVAENRTAFMVGASVAAARLVLRQREDDEIERLCAETAERDLAMSIEFEGTLADGLDDEPW